MGQFYLRGAAMASDTDKTHDFLTLGGDDDVATKPSMFEKPEVSAGHCEPAVPAAQPRTQTVASAGAATAGAAVAGAAAGAAAAGAAQPDANQAAYAKLKADRAKARQEKRRGKKKADPLDKELTAIEKEQDDINKKYAEGSGAGMAVLLVACVVLLAVCGFLFYLHGDGMIETFKNTPWFRYIWIVVAMYSYANSKY